MIKSPEGELSRVDSPPMAERSNFMTNSNEADVDTQLILNNGQGTTRESADNFVSSINNAMAAVTDQAANPLTAQGSDSNRASFKKKQRKERTSLTQKLAMSN